MVKRNRKRTINRIAFLILLLLACILVSIFVFNDSVTAPKTSISKQNESASIPKPAVNVGFDKTQFSTTQPGSPWWIVNKNRPLPNGYVPADLAVPSVSLRLPAGSEQMQLSKQVIPSLEAMFKAASAAGAPLVFASGYRSEAYQRQLYQSYVNRDGQAAADRYSAKPGTSEHQTGLSFDVCAAGTSCELSQAFAETLAGQWVAANAHQYGFIIHYLQGKESITGYDYEPWHLRYVGVELATELKNNGQALEEFLL